MVAVQTVGWAMAERWRVLALLFVVRTTMAFQFQSVGALGPLVRQAFGVGLPDLGLLIGLYLSPGLVLAVPAAGIGRRFGEKRCVLAGMALMIVGGLVMAEAPGWGAQIAGRLLAGLGGVALNVLMAKMVTDWFAGREIATAMGIYVNSWPFGIAVALLVLPVVAGTVGLRGAYLLAAGATAAGLLLMTRYRATADAQQAGQAGGAPSGRVLVAIVVAGLIWGLFNGAVSMVFSFGNAVLTERGWSLAAAGGATSLSLWCGVLSVPLGGLLADRLGRHGMVLVGGCIGFALMLAIAARTDAVLPAFAVLGLVWGLPAGPIMGLPARVLSAQTRAVGMGIFWTLFYLVVVTAPWIAGQLSAATGTVRTAFNFGIVMLVLTCAGYAGFGRLVGRAA